MGIDPKFEVAHELSTLVNSINGIKDQKEIFKQLKNGIGKFFHPNFQPFLPSHFNEILLFLILISGKDILSREILVLTKILLR